MFSSLIGLMTPRQQDAGLEGYNRGEGGQLQEGGGHHRPPPEAKEVATLFPLPN